MNHSVKGDLEEINRLLKELTGAYRTAFSRAGVSENEFWIWYALLIYGGEYAQQDICELWALPKQTTNTIINHMVQKGYATLEVIPGTRNRKRIRVSQAGREYGEQIVMPIYHAERQSIFQLPPEERKLCLEILARYIHIFKGELCGS